MANTRTPLVSCPHPPPPLHPAAYQPHWQTMCPVHCMSHLQNGFVIVLSISIKRCTPKSSTPPFFRCQCNILYIVVKGGAKLRHRELNPGLPRDRRKYEPLYYSGFGHMFRTSWLQTPFLVICSKLRECGHLPTGDIYKTVMCRSTTARSSSCCHAATVRPPNCTNCLVSI